MQVSALSLSLAREQLESVILKRVGKPTEARAILDAIDAVISARVAHDVKRALLEIRCPAALGLPPCHDCKITG